MTYAYTFPLFLCWIIVEDYRLPTFFLTWNNVIEAKIVLFNKRKVKNTLLK